MVKKVGQGKLTPRKKRFVDEYMKDLNATQAAIRSGYSPKVAHVNGPRLLTNADVQAHLSIRMKAREARTEITQDRVLRELAKIAFQDVRSLYREDGSLIPIKELDDAAAASIAGVEVLTRSVLDRGGEETDDPIMAITTKIKLSDKRAALVDVGRHLGMFKDKLEHSGPDGGPIPVIGNYIISPEKAKDMTEWELLANPPKSLEDE